MTKVSIANHSPYPYFGWMRRLIDVRPKADKGTVDGIDWVLGDKVGKDTYTLDIRCKMTTGLITSFDLDKSTALASPPVMPANLDFLALFGGPMKFGNQPMSVIHYAFNGAGLDIHCRGKAGASLVCDVWLTWYPKQPWAEGRVMLVSANPAVGNVTETITDQHTLTFGDAVMHIPGKGVVADNKLINSGEWLYDGQGRALPVIFAWPRLFISADQWASIAALVERKFGMVALQGPLYPSGNPRKAPNFDVISWAISNYIQSEHALNSFNDWPSIGPNKVSGDTGAQEDQIFTGGEALLIPGAEWPSVFASLKLAERPCQFREVDGSMLDPDKHPQLVFWDGRPHWHTGVSPDRLGKSVGFDLGMAHGRLGPDVEHWLMCRLAASHRITGDPALQYLLRQQAVVYLLQWTAAPGYSTSQPYASRARGYEALNVMLLDRELSDRVLASKVVERYKTRMLNITIPFERNEGTWWDKRYDDPRLGTGPWAIAWQQALGAYFQDMACAMYSLPEGRDRAYMAALAIVDSAWKKVGNDWFSAPQLSTQNIPAEGVGVDASFNYFGMCLAPVTVLKHDPKNVKAREIWEYLLRNATLPHQVKWLPPEDV